MNVLKILIIVATLVFSGCQIESLGSAQSGQESSQVTGIDTGDDNFGSADTTDSNKQGDGVITLVSPAQGTRFEESSLLLTFSAAENGWLYVGYTEQAADIYDGPIDQMQLELALEDMYGELFLTVWTLIDGKWVATKYELEKLKPEEPGTGEGTVQTPVKSALLLPAQDQLLTSNTLQVVIDRLNMNYLYIGTEPGADDVLNTRLHSEVTQVSLDLTGADLFFTLWTHDGNQWHANQYQFATADLRTDGATDVGGNTDYGQTDGHGTVDEDGLQYVDIMVLFNKTARAKGDSVLWAESAVAYNNQVFENSKVNLRLRLAHVGTAPALFDQELGSWTLGDMRRHSELNAMRVAYGADVVGIISAGPESFCGWSGIPVFNVSDWSLKYHDDNYFWSRYACEGWGFSHEVGHSLGLEHSIKETPYNVEPTPYGRGYGVYGRFGTLMTYSSNYGIQWGQLLPMYSNPDIQTCDGDLPCGIDRHHADGADAAYLLNQGAAALSGLYPSKLPAPPPSVP